MDTQLKENMQNLIDMTLRAGADSCDVILSKGESFSLSAQNEKIDKYQVSGSQVMGLRVIKDQKIGLAYTESMDRDALSFISQAAIENAKNGEVNPNETIEVNESEQINASEFSKDGASTTEKIDFCLSLESEVKARDSRVKVVPYNGFSETDYSLYYLNSLGTFTYDSEYYQSCYTSALINEGKESSMHYHSSMARNMADLDKEECIKESLEHASEWIKAMPLRTGEYDVIFTPDAFASVFGCFSNIFSAKAAMEKTNPFAERLGDQVMSDQVTIKDLPFYKDAFFKNFVDSEGRKHEDLTLVEGGELKSFYHNTATANFFKTTSTAHGKRGAKSPLTVAGTTKVIDAGKASESEWNAGEYFEIHALQGLHSGANATSGDFSMAASGYYMRDGKRVRPVKGVTVSGNFHKMMKDIKILGNEIKATTSRDFFAPILRFEKVSIAGS